ncbi:MAG: M20/M25/M40 family metallo-hydrolase [Bacteroidales bacterium]
MSEQERLVRLEKDVAVLAADSLLGREAGTKGEIMAMSYLASRFQQMQLKPILSDNTYFQEFEFISGATYKDGTSLIAGEKPLILEQEFYPLSYSASKAVQTELIDVGFGLDTEAAATNDYADKSSIQGKAFLMQLSVPGGIDNFVDYARQAEIPAKIANAEKHGAAAVVFVNDDPNMADPSDKISLRVIPADIPVVFVNDQAAEKVKQAIGKTVDINVSIRKIRASAYNVVGLIDNNAAYTIVLGAHYDHLGMGGPSSRYVGPPEVHNGADDNASGVAGIMEMARKATLKQNPRFNYLIIAFSAEEHGLIGSSYFTKSKAYPMDKINAMINFDMIGRMKDNTMRIVGTGTSPVWENLIKQSNTENLRLRTSKSGSGGSDQMSFYLDSIPVLFYFTGSHEDYHKPSDDIEKLKFSSMLDIIESVERLVELLPYDKKLEFKKTESRRQSGRNPTKYTVTLGVMPDHTFEGKGMRIENVIQGRVSDEAGLKDGDVIIQMGEHEVTDIMSYMKALSKFKKGQTTTIQVKRGNNILEKQVQFK